MKKCSVCRKPITVEEPAILFIGQDGDEKEVCTLCEQKVEVLMESENPEEIKEAVNYLHTCSLSASDSEVASFLRETIEANSGVIKELEDKKIKSEPVNTTNKRDYFSERQSAEETEGDGSFWISGMKVFAWIAFTGIIISGIVIANQVGENSGGMGFLTFVGSVILAFLSVAMLMIFLNLAQDVSMMKKEISEIKQELGKKSKK